MGLTRQELEVVYSELTESEYDDYKLCDENDKFGGCNACHAVRIIRREISLKDIEDEQNTARSQTPKT